MVPTQTRNELLKYCNLFSWPRIRIPTIMEIGRNPIIAARAGLFTLFPTYCVVANNAPPTIKVFNKDNCSDAIIRDRAITILAIYFIMGASPHTPQRNHYTPRLGASPPHPAAEPLHPPTGGQPPTPRSGASCGHPDQRPGKYRERSYERSFPEITRCGGSGGLRPPQVRSSAACVCKNDLGIHFRQSTTWPASCR